MAYNKQQWKDEIPDLTKPIRDSSGKQKTDPQTGRPLYELVQEGTRLTAQRLNHIEDGIETIHELADQNAADIDTHKKDTVKHITAAERAEWKAKETPAGAQTKADAALSAAKTYADTALLAKADKSSTYSKTETDQRIQAVVGAAPDALDTLKEIGDALNNDPNFAATVTNQLSGKVDKVSGKQLSTEDYSSAEKAKLAGLTPGAGAAGSATDATIGNRTADPSITTPYSLTGTITQWFSWITKYLKAITGKANPFDVPDITLATTKTHVDNTTVHITAAERVKWNAAEGNATAASIPLAQKGAASGVPALDSQKYVLGDGINLRDFYTEYVSTFSFAHNIANQKVDLITTGALAGFFEVTVTGTFGNQNNVGRMTKRFNIMTNTSGMINSQLPQYTEVTGPIVNCVSISDAWWDATNSQWRITIEARSSNGNGYAVHIKRLTSQSTLNTKPFTLGSVYTGTAATTLPVAVQVIPDDTVLLSGKEFQKFRLTQNNGTAFVITSGSADTYMTSGLYQVQSTTVTGLPLATTGILEVTDYMQRFTETPTMRTWKRRYAGTWNAWVEDENSSRKNVANGYAGLDGSAFVPDARIAPSIARKAIEIPANADLNTYTSEGEYYQGTSSVAATITNKPASAAFYLRVSRHNGVNQWFITFGIPGTGEMFIYTRNVYQGAWGAWEEIETTSKKNKASGYGGLDTNAKLPRVNTYSSLGATGGISNLDSAFTAGTYSVSTGIPGSPSPTEYGQVLIHLSSGETHDSSTNWIWQMFYGTLGNTYVRRKVNNGAWSAWVPMWTGYNDAPLFMTRTPIANNTDFNTLTNNGIYAMSAATGLLNALPTILHGIVSVSRTDGSSPFVKQEATDITTGVTQTRFRTGSNTWTPWVTNITSVGGVLNAGLARNYNGTLYKYDNLAGYVTSGTTTGTVKITLPKTWSNTMMRLKISGYDYAANKGAWELMIGAYNYGGTPIGWAQPSVNVLGKPPFTSVRLAHDGTNNCILLGTTSTVWGITSIEVSEMMASFTNISGWEKGWQISLLAAETGIVNVFSPVMAYGNADTLGGWLPSQTATANTIAVRNAKGELEGVSSTLSKVDDTPIAKSSAGLMALNYNVTGTDHTLTVSAYLSLMSASNFSMYISYTDPRLGLKNYEICPLKRLEGEAYVFVPAFIRAKAGTEVRLMVVHSDDAFPAYITASIGKG